MNTIETEKPTCKLTGENGNIYNLTALASAALKKNNQRDKIAEMKSRVSSAENYDTALSIIQEYVTAE